MWVDIWDNSGVDMERPPSSAERRAEELELEAADECDLRGGEATGRAERLSMNGSSMMRMPVSRLVSMVRTLGTFLARKVGGALGRGTSFDAFLTGGGATGLGFETVLRDLEAGVFVG